MDEQTAHQSEYESNEDGRRGRGVVTALVVAGVLAAVPAGVALAGGSGGSAADDGGASGAGAVHAQSTSPEDAQRDRGRGDHGDCPEKDGQGGQESTQL
jgi:hypothetical protein